MCSCVRKKESVVVGSCSRGTSYYTYLHEEHEVGTEKEPEDVEITGLLGGITLEFLDLRSEGSEGGFRRGHSWKIL